MTKRRVRPDELELWQQVAKNTERLHTPRPAPVKNTAPAPKRPLPEAQDIVLPPVSIGTRTRSHAEIRDLAPSLSDRLHSAPVGMDAKSFKSMKRGKLKPEGRIDLHGMTVAQAHPALSRFILSSHSAGKRLVLVITGKGGRREEDWSVAPERMGILKRQVPMWLTQPPLASAVLQVSESHIRHGGTGAYYVYLRRLR